MGEPSWLKERQTTHNVGAGHRDSACMLRILMLDFQDFEIGTCTLYFEKTRIENHQNPIFWILIFFNTGIYLGSLYFNEKTCLRYL